MEIIFLPPARTELTDATSYYNMQSEGLGYEFAAEVKRTLERIVKNLWRLNMKTDPIVEQVRQVRREIEDETQQDPELFYQHLKKIQERLSDRLVCRKPKPLVTITKTRVA